jgi:uracil-DNA glycosylase family 4
LTITTHAAFNPACEACPRLAPFLAQIRQQYPDYHARPVAAFGDPNPDLLIVGLAPGMHGANATGRPFTGDFAGILLYETLHHFGFATQPVSNHRDDDLQLINCRITNAVKCLPPQNKPTTEEIQRCNTFLQNELAELRENTVILALGTIAHKAVLKAEGLKQSAYPFAHLAVHPLPSGHTLVDSYHTSRYNIQTRRLTTPMFHQVFESIRSHLPGYGD